MRGCQVVFFLGTLSEVRFVATLCVPACMTKENCHCQKVPASPFSVCSAEIRQEVLRYLCGDLRSVSTYLLTPTRPSAPGTKGLKLVWAKLPSCFCSTSRLLFFLYVRSLPPRPLSICVLWESAQVGSLLTPVCCHTTAAASFTTRGLNINLCKAWAQFSSLAACACCI